MGTLSKEIEKLKDALKTPCYFCPPEKVECWGKEQKFTDIDIIQARIRQIESLQRDFPHLDHPATPLVEEVVELAKELGKNDCVFHPPSVQTEVMDCSVCHIINRAKALLQKIKEAK